MKIIIGLLFLIFSLLISCVAAKKARLYRVLADDFTLNLNFHPCSGQTACLCYKTSEKGIKKPKNSSALLVLCDNPDDAFICARHKINLINASKNETEEETTLVVHTSALKHEITSNINLIQNVNSLSFYVNINEKNAKIDASSNVIISEFWNFHYKSLDQRIVKLYVSSCEDNVKITSDNLEEINIKETLEGSSIWETITTYLYNTGDKALNVATTALRILAGVLKIDIFPEHDLPTIANPTICTDSETLPTSTTSTTKVPATITTTTKTSTTSSTSTTATSSTPKS